MRNPPRAFDPEGAFRCQALRAFVVAAIARWKRRSRTRRELLALSDRDLRDVGLSMYEREGAKWFWQR